MGLSNESSLYQQYEIFCLLNHYLMKIFEHYCIVLFFVIKLMDSYTNYLQLYLKLIKFIFEVIIICHLRLEFKGVMQAFLLILQILHVPMNY